MSTILLFYCESLTLVGFPCGMSAPVSMMSHSENRTLLPADSHYAAQPLAQFLTSDTHTLVKLGQMDSLAWTFEIRIERGLVCFSVTTRNMGWPVLRKQREFLMEMEGNRL